MPVFKDSELLTRLTHALGEKKDKLAKLMRSLTGIGHSENMKPSVFRRFLMTMEHIAEVKDDETKIIHQIDAIEEEHRKRRQFHLLRNAAPPAPQPAPETLAAVPESKRPDNSFWWLLAFWYMLTPKKENNK